MKTKKKLRLAGKKVNKTALRTIDPFAANAAAAERMNNFVNAQMVIAREAGIKQALGLDVYESVKALTAEANEARRLLVKLDMHSHSATEIDMDLVEVRSFLDKPRAQFVMKPPQQHAYYADPTRDAKLPPACRICGEAEWRHAAATAKEMYEKTLSPATIVPPPLDGMYAMSPQVAVDALVAEGKRTGFYGPTADASAQIDSPTAAPPPALSVVPDAAPPAEPQSGEAQVTPGP